jgi:hypothetical protein
MPVIPATQEAEIRRIMVHSQPGEIVHETLALKKSITKKGWWSGSRCRPWVQSPVPPKQKTNKQKNITHLGWFGTMLLSQRQRTNSMLLST